MQTRHVANGARRSTKLNRRASVHSGCTPPAFWYIEIGASVHLSVHARHTVRSTDCSPMVHSRRVSPPPCERQQRVHRGWATDPTRPAWLRHAGVARNRGCLVHRWSTMSIATSAYRPTPLSLLSPAPEPKELGNSQLFAVFSTRRVGCGNPPDRAAHRLLATTTERAGKASKLLHFLALSRCRPVGPEQKFRTHRFRWT